MTDKKGIVSIHGKEYMTVARRVELAHVDGLLNVDTEVLLHDPVVVKAVVTIVGEKGVKTYSGISSIDLSSSKMIEKSNPYEVAETSAVGRALGFAGYGLMDSIASADEMRKAQVVQREDAGLTYERVEDTNSEDSYAINPNELICDKCGEAATEKKGTSKAGKDYHAIFCSSKDGTHTKWLPK